MKFKEYLKQWEDAKSKIISLEKTIAKDQDKFLKKVKEIGEDINDQT